MSAEEMKVYCTAQLSAIHEAYVQSGSDVDEDNFALLWVIEHGADFRAAWNHSDVEAI